MKIPEHTRKHEFMCRSRWGEDCNCQVTKSSFAQRTSEPFGIICIKDVVMNESENVTFIAGKKYVAWLWDDGAIDAFNEEEHEHTICDNDLEMKAFFNEHFRG